MKLFGKNIVFGISLKVSLGLMLIILVTFVSSGVVKRYFDKSAIMFERISKEQIPLLITTSKLTKEVKGLIFNGSELILAKNPLSLESLLINIATDVNRIQSLISELKATNVEGATDLSLKIQHISKNLQDLVSLIKEDMKVSQRILQISIHMRRTAESLTLESGPQQNRIRELFVQVFSLLRDVPNIPDGQRLEEYQDQILKSKKMIDDTLQGETFMRFSKVLEVYGVGEKGLLALTKTHLHLKTLIHDKLVQISFLSDELIKQTDHVFLGVSSTIYQQSQKVAEEIELIKRLLLLIPLVIALSAILILLFIRRSVVGRILALEQSMKAHVGGNPLPIPVEGKDEIASMAQSVSYFVENRKQAEDELRQYEHIVSSTKDLLALIDKNFVFLSANSAYMQAFAKTLDQMIGRTVTDVFGEEFFSKVIRPRAERCLAGENIRYQDWFDFPATGRRYMDVAYSPYFGPGTEVQGFVVTARDITEYENLQGQLVQALKMESVGRLAGGVAHDYNNISSIIIGYSELALEKVDQDDPLHDDLMEIYTAANRSTNITRQLLAFARKQTIEPKVLDLNDAIESLLKMLRRLIGEDIDLAWLPGADVWPVKIDPSQVDQILANLCVNARDAIADVGKVTIETKNISFDEDYCADHAGFVPGEFVLFAVSDDGSGIAPETLDKVFEPFFTTKGVGQGTGLGLATVYGIVKQNNGFINVYSEPKKGTTLKIYLPRHTGKIVEARHESTLENPLSRGETVLLVEDDGSIMKLGKRMLNDLGYSVLSATTPGEAISLAEGHVDEINLLVTDVVMPEMNGRELSEQLKRLYPNLKTLFMSGYTANVIAHRGVLEDGVCFIPKPFSKKDLSVKVRETLDKDNRNYRITNMPIYNQDKMKPFQ